MSLKVAVIGAGITGLQTACFLAKAGHRVTLFEKQTIPPVNPSSIAGGMLAPFSEIETLPMRFVQVGIKGMELWDELLGEEKARMLVRKSGSLLVAHPSDEHMMSRFAQNLRFLCHPWSWVDHSDIQKLEPSLKSRFQKGIFIPDEAFLLPLQALEMLLECFGEYGGSIIQEEVSPSDLKPHFDWVVDCRGYVENTDRDLRGVLGEIMVVRNRDFCLSRPVRLMHPRYPLYIIPRSNQIFAIGATMIECAGEEDGLVTARSAMELLSAAFTLHPSFAEAKIIHLHSGIRAAYPDNLPRLYIDTDKKYMRCNGLFRHGYLLAPVIAKMAEHYITSGKLAPEYDLFSGKSNHAIMRSEISTAG